MIVPHLQHMLSRARLALGLDRPTGRVREWVLRGLGVVHLLAFGSLAVQAKALLGSAGILPAADYLERARSAGLGFFDVPTLFWLSAADGVLTATWILGLACAAALVAGWAPRVMLLGLFALYLSFASVGQAFFAFQWDSLLLESTLLAAVWAPNTWTLRRGREHSDLGVLLLRFLAMRLVLGSGLVKFLSGDPTWRDFTALSYHYWTQPLPNPLSPLFDALPMAVDRASVAVLFFLELVVPLLCVRPRRLRHLACFLLIGLQLGILASGNYGFFTFNALVLCLSLLDDYAFRREPSEQTKPLPLSRDLLTAATVGVLLVGGGAAFINGVTFRERYSIPLRELRWAHSYGLFAVMTTTRDEIALEGSADGRSWHPYVFRYKPGPLDRAPPLVFPGHMPRVDWLMWFAALGECREAGWFLLMQRELLRGNGVVGSVFETNPFAQEPPKLLRSLRRPYRFAPLSAEDAWTAGEATPFCPTLTWRDGQLQIAP